MTLLEELMKQYKTNIDEVVKYSGVDKVALAKYYSGELSLRKCAIEDFAVLAKVFRLTVQELWNMAEHYDFNPKDFEIFKSNTCHSVKRLGIVEEMCLIKLVYIRAGETDESSLSII